jgi:hypothetical protein
MSDIVAFFVAVVVAAAVCNDPRQEHQHQHQRRLHAVVTALEIPVGNKKILGHGHGLDLECSNHPDADSDESGNLRKEKMNTNQKIKMVISHRRRHYCGMSGTWLQLGENWGDR